MSDAKTNKTRGHPYKNKKIEVYIRESENGVPTLAAAPFVFFKSYFIQDKQIRGLLFPFDLPFSCLSFLFIDDTLGGRGVWLENGKNGAV